MSLKTQIDNEIKAAMLSKNKVELTALRSLKSLILLAETEKGNWGELTQEAEMKLLLKAAKQRKESAEIFQKEGRLELAEKERLELEVINRYLPQQMSEEELVVELKKIIETIGAKNSADVGKVIGRAVKELAGKVDGKLISETVKKLLPS